MVTLLNLGNIGTYLVRIRYQFTLSRAQFEVKVNPCDQSAHLLTSLVLFFLFSAPNQFWETSQGNIICRNS